MPLETTAAFKSGIVVIVGAPNVGKSTLLNRMLGQKISIVSPKPQTTRNRILGVVHRPDVQIVLIDTPGIHPSAKPLNARIVAAAIEALADVDAAVLMIDICVPDPEAEAMIVSRLHTLRKPVVLVLNKIDRVPESPVLEAIRRWSAAFSFHAVIPICARRGEGVERLVQTLVALLPPGPPLFPEDAVTDAPERFIAAELIREKVFRQTGQEIPYATAVTVEDFREDARRGRVSIHATIHVERDSQKAIVIGKGGSKLKRIGEDARKDLERMLGAGVFLKLFVRVQKNWTRDTRALRRFGY